jgi:hypothetical protein
VLTNQDLSHAYLVNSVIANQNPHIVHCLIMMEMFEDSQSAGICCGKVTLGQAGFTQVLRFPLPILIPTTPPY